MNYTPPRPEGFDYNKPDELKDRCMKCNPDGFNRTGLKPICLYGTSTTVALGVKCECDNGLKNG